ncbi:hypothetical protein NM688_g1577 [Phlebia brevispora]|uniref:Uncharacterized protein n=1 Tax=Phlebia brevispora TaxID=194682 RepID=A0ACC1TBC8_9APHY|nr:hypothetical protein NM688_g1577 [Phlebia brevispora]
MKLTISSTAFATLALLRSVGAQQQEWGQCGGVGYTGPTGTYISSLVWTVCANSAISLCFWNSLRVPQYVLLVRIPHIALTWSKAMSGAYNNVYYERRPFLVLKRATLLDSGECVYRRLIFASKHLLGLTATS